MKRKKSKFSKLALVINTKWILDIDRTLTGFMQCDISSEFCATLLVPFLKHAAENNQLSEEILVYSRIFQDIYIYVLKDDPSNDQLLIEAQQSLLG